METILALDYQILHFIASHFRSGIMNAIMLFMTFLGDHGLVWITVGAALLLRPRTRRWGITLLLALAVTAALSEYGLKFLIERARPFLQYPEFSTLILPPDGYSFPSSHTATAFACATVLFFMKKPAGIGAGVLAAAIAFSRLYFCVHFPTDVLAGVLLGIALGVLMTFAVRRISDRLHYSKLR